LLSLIPAQILIVATAISVKPNPSGLPGTSALSHLLDGVAAVALLGCGAAIVLGAAQWGLGNRSNNYSQAADGKTKMLYGAAGAFVVGATAAIINFFYNAGSAVH
jgi:hypothetical protein